MENHIETNFREIQKILDSCVSHGYKTKVDALFLKREYLTQAQLKDYLRQEIFRVTENIVAIQQKYRVVRDVNNNQKMYQIIIKKWATATCKNIKILERGKGYFPLFIFCLDKIQGSL